jgi:hypothetical protein
MKRLSIAITSGLILLVGSDAFAQEESAKVQVTLKIPAKEASFKDQRLVIYLSHDNPLKGDDARDTPVDRHIDKTFSHTKGKETVLTLTLGEKAKLNTKLQYGVSVTVFDAKSKRTHIGESDGQSLCYVLTYGSPDRVTLVVRPVD